MTSTKLGIVGSVAGEGVVPPHNPALEAALAIGLVLLIAFGAFVASTVSSNLELKAAVPVQAVD